MTLEEVHDLKIVDTDTHVVEPADLWTSRVSVKKWGDLVPHVKWDSEKGQEAWYFGSGRIEGRSAWSSAMAGWREYPPDCPKSFSDVAREMWAPDARLKVMDDYGIWAQVLYPNVAGFGAGQYLGLKEPELMLACVRAYNDFLAEWGQFAPGRYIPVMALPFWDIAESLKEMARAADSGHKGIIFGNEPESFGSPPLISPHWDPIWAAAQDMGLAINFHIAAGDITPQHQIVEQMGRRAYHAAHPITFFLGNARTLTHLIAGGICHRFPRLNFVSVESGVGWIPFVLEALEWQWRNCDVRGEHPEYDLLPTEYFQRQIYGCFWFERDENLRHSISAIGAGNILYETDFPHSTSMSPGPKSSAVQPDLFVKQAMAGVDKQDIAKILHDNAAAIYGLD